jgi:transcription initiation factor TFIIIB Brf1 subunit/transcription initiation factor TFIIB
LYNESTNDLKETKMNKNLYVVTAKCGHVGKNKYIPIDFPVKASSMKEAAERIRNRPRVKHHHKDAIITIQVVDQETFDKLLDVNSSDQYLKVSSSTDQRRFCESLDERIVAEDYKQEERDPWERAKRIGGLMRRRMLKLQSWEGRHA